MATVADYDGQLAAKLVVLQAAPTRLPSDFLQERTGVPTGAARFQLQVAPAGRDRDSNGAALTCFVRARVLHRLADPANERTYTLGNMATDLDAVTDFAYWKTAAVASVIERLRVETERRGDLVIWTLEITVSLVP